MSSKKSELSDQDAESDTHKRLTETIAALACLEYATHRL
jgi:hypothetical protein